MQPQPQSPQQNTRYYLSVLHELIEIGLATARSIRDDAQSPAEPGAPKPDPTIPLERVTRTIRRTILLAQNLQKPQKPTRETAAPTDPLAARKNIIRRVEDDIHRDAKGPRAEALNAEFRERLDAPDLAYDIETRDIKDIITDITNDLGLGMHSAGVTWNKRRTPADIEILNARAAGLPISPKPPPNEPPPDPRHDPEPDGHGKHFDPTPAEFVQSILAYDKSRRLSQPDRNPPRNTSSPE